MLTDLNLTQVIRKSTQKQESTDLNATHPLNGLFQMQTQILSKFSTQQLSSETLTNSSKFKNRPKLASVQRLASQSSIENQIKRDKKSYSDLVKKLLNQS